MYHYNNHSIPLYIIILYNVVNPMISHQKKKTQILMGGIPTIPSQGRFMALVFPHRDDPRDLK